MSDPYILKDGVPCSHKGCMGHTTHPCEVCGRICMMFLSDEAINKRLDFIFFKYKGSEYRLIKPLMMKNPFTRKWHKAVLYEVYNDPSKSYVRKIQDFAKKFEGFQP